MKALFNFTVLSTMTVGQLIGQTIDLSDSLLMEAEKFREPAEKVRALMNLIELNYQSNPEMTLKPAQKLVQLANAFGSTEEKGDANRYLAAIYRYRFQQDKAFRNYLKSLKYYKECNIQGKIAKVNNEMGLLFYSVKDYPAAMEYFKKSLTIYLEESNESRATTLYFNVGVCYKMTSQFEMAMDHYQNALEIAYSIRDQTQINDVYNYLGILYYDASDYENARKYYFKSIETLGEAKENRLSIAYNNIGETYHGSGNYEQARHYFQEAMVMKRKLGDKNLIASTLINLGKLAMTENKPDSAILLLEEALSLLDTAMINRNLREASSLLVEAYENKKNPSEEDYQRIIELNRHYITHIHNANTNNNQKLFNLMLIKDEIEEEAQYLQRKTKIMQSRSLWIMAIAAVVVLGLLLLLHYREQRFKNFIQRMWEDIKDI